MFLAKKITQIFRIGKLKKKLLTKFRRIFRKFLVWKIPEIKNFPRILQQKRKIFNSFELIFSEFIGPKKFQKILG